MTKTAIATDIHEALDVHLDALAEVALGLALSVDDGADLVQFVLAQIADLGVHIDRGLLEDGGRARLADAVNVRQTNLCPLVGR